MEQSGSIKKIMLAYSGGLDTSAMLHWLKKTYECPVVAFVADVGQEDDFEEVRQKALATGAEECIISDLKDEFVSEFIYPAIQAHAIYEDVYLLGTSLARPPIARAQVLAAKECGADCLAHGSTGKGNDQVRFELTYQALAPEIKILAPWRLWNFTSRSDLIEYSHQNAIPITSTLEKPYSIDQNLMHTSYEGGILEDPWNLAPPDIFLTTVDPLEAPDNPEILRLEFSKGLPVSLDGVSLSPTDLISELNTRAGKHGVGRVDLVENRFVGMKSRGVYETPGVTVLHEAHRALESLVLDREVQHLKDRLGNELATKIYNGFWFAPETQLLLSAIAQTQKSVTGEVEMQLFKGSCTVLRKRSQESIYDPDYATFESDTVYDQADAGGFIRLQGLRLRMSGKEKGSEDS